VRTSLLLVSRNEESNVQRFLKSLKKQSKKLDEIVLVDSSDDRTVEMMKPYMDKIIKVEPYSCAYQRWVGMKHVTGDIVLLTDIDAELHPRWAEEMVKMFKDPEVNVVQGQVTGYGFAEEDWMFSKRLPKIGKYLNHSNTGYRRRALMEMKFDPNLRYYEDREMSYRIGRFSNYVIHGCKEAKVWHHQGGHGMEGRRLDKDSYTGALKGMKGAVSLAIKHKTPHWLLRAWFNIVYTLIIGRVTYSFIMAVAFFNAVLLMFVKPGAYRGKHPNGEAVIHEK